MIQLLFWQSKQLEMLQIVVEFVELLMAVVLELFTMQFIIFYDLIPGLPHVEHMFVDKEQSVQ